MQRTITPEIMDQPDVAREDLAESLRFIRWVNRNLGGHASLLGHLKRWSRKWPRDRTITLLDIATGSADLPIAAQRWAQRAGFDLRITAIDAHETTLDLARRHVAEELGSDDPGHSGIELIQADALKLTDRFDVDAFDYVHAGLFLHHLQEIEIFTMLRMMDRLARAGIIWNDLIRSRIALVGIHLLTLGQPEIVKHDARVSVRAGFTRREVKEIRKRLGLEYCRYRANFLTQRFTLAGENQGSWVLV